MRCWRKSPPRRPIRKTGPTKGWAWSASRFNRRCSVCMIQPWRQLSSRERGDFRIFSVREERKVSPRTGREHDFFIIDSSSWVDVVALTPDRHIILIEQYRHGSNTVELEIPGGIIDATDATP